MKQLQGIYFYNGFNEPKMVASDIYVFVDDLRNKETVITSNYLGDLSDVLLSELEYTLHNNYDVEDINNSLNYYSLFYQPTIKVFQELNELYGLDKNEYLKGLI